ncbi:unnamed protein product, partial [marine sediment metagenome]
ETGTILTNTGTELDALVTQVLENNKTATQELEALTQKTVNDTINHAKSQHTDANNQIETQKEAQLEGIVTWTSEFADKVQTITTSNREHLNKMLDDTEIALKEEIDSIQKQIGQETETAVTTDGTLVNKFELCLRLVL